MLHTFPSMPGKIASALAGAAKGAAAKSVERLALAGKGTAYLQKEAFKATVKAITKKSVKKGVREALIALPAVAAAKEVGESIVKNIFCDKVKPRRGSILRCDLAGGTASHTGVYLGKDRIAEVTEVDGRAKVQIVDPSEFLSGEGLSLRTGVYIYVAAAEDRTGKFRALHSYEIARRAERAVGPRGEYSLVSNNCHMFTCYCITGEEPDESVLSADTVLAALESELGVSGAEWRSTGFGYGDSSFNAVS